MCSQKNQEHQSSDGTNRTQHILVWRSLNICEPWIPSVAFFLSFFCPPVTWNLPVEIVFLFSKSYCFHSLFVYMYRYPAMVYLLCPTPPSPHPGHYKIISQYLELQSSSTSWGDKWVGTGMENCLYRTQLRFKFGISLNPLAITINL